MKTEKVNHVGRHGPRNRKRSEEWLIKTLISAKNKTFIEKPEFFNLTDIFFTQNCVNGPPGKEWPPG
jgi:hypothetical protein